VLTSKKKSFRPRAQPLIDLRVARFRLGDGTDLAAWTDRTDDCRRRQRRVGSGKAHRNDNADRNERAHEAIDNSIQKLRV